MNAKADLCDEIARFIRFAQDESGEGESLYDRAEEAFEALYRLRTECGGHHKVDGAFEALARGKQ